MEDKRLKLLKEQRIKRFKQLIGLNEDIEPKRHMGEGEAVASSDPNSYPELDGYVDQLTLGVQNLITKELAKNGDDHEMPYKAEYIVQGLIKGLQAPLSINETLSNFYQGMQPKQAIEKAKVDYGLSIKKGNEGQADKIAGNLKSFLDAHGYNWKQDPYAMEILSDYI